MKNRSRIGFTLLFAAILMLGLLLASSSSAPVVVAAELEVVFDDMEHGDPFANGWFSFGGSVGGGGIGPNSTDLPPNDGGAFSLETGWGSGGVPGFFGGFGRTNPTGLSGTNYFNFWINPDAGQDYTLEINLQEDDNGDDVIADPNNGADDEFQYNCVVSPDGPCAVSGGGWQLVSIPLADFFDDNAFLTGGNGLLDAIPTSDGGNGRLINIVIAVISNSGADVTFRTDNWIFSDTSLANPTLIIDDFESGLPTGTDGDGNGIGFVTFSDGSLINITTTNTPPAPVPSAGSGNNVLAMTGDVAAFAGFVHAFENPALDTWVTQDWSSFEGLSFWLYGQGTGATLFVDILDNRNPGSTTDDAERFTVSFVDDFTGWQFLEFPFSDFVRKEIGNGAPNDGLTLTQVHGWALGMLQTGGEVTFYVDDATLYGIAQIPELAVTFAATNYDIDEGDAGPITVQLNRPLNSNDPAQVSVDYYTEPGLAIPGRDYEAPAPGTLTFVNGGPSALSFSLQTLQDTKFEGTERVILRLTNPVDVAAGFAMQAAASIVDDDPYDPYLLDDFERFPHLWQSSDNVTLSNPTLTAGDPLARPGQDAYEGVLQVNGPLAVDIDIQGPICRKGRGVIPVNLLTTDTFDATTVDHATVTLGDAYETHGRRHEEDVDDDGDLDLVFHFRAGETGIDCEADVIPFNGQTFDGQPITAGGANAAFFRDFAIGKDWSNAQSLNFWYYGTNSGQDVTVQLKDNRAPDPGPGGWSLAWSDEFDEPAGTPPDPANWSYEIGDGTVNGIPGWGNDEFQYYTDDPANAATDGQGNMVLTVREADGSLPCYYGPCDYTSARLITKQKAEFAYGRIESRILVPDGEAGLWPAFWSLGTDIDVVGWPQTGEIDFMEYVSRLPNEIFGTVHGPGYSGGQSYGNVYDFGEPVSDDYHTFTIEWQPDLIEWYVDGAPYHTATPADVAGEWVFNDPVYLLLNVAIGGNFGGAIDPDLQLPQSMAVDYIRVYQGPDTAERFEARFVDNFSGWQLVEVPINSFTRSAGQPAGAPDDGLTLTEVWGYGFTLPHSGLPAGAAWLDVVALEPLPRPPAVTVSTLADGGPGSLREALDIVADGGAISFDPGLAGGTIPLTSGQLVLNRSVTIDGSGAPGLTISGNNASRVLQIVPGITASINDLTIADGAGAPQGGGILNFGTLNLDFVTVTNNTETGAGPASFELGGGGIYNGDGATLNLSNSTVSDNRTVAQPGGGIYGFFNSAINVTNSTVSGNVSLDVAGGLRTLGDVNIVNSTISGNTSTVWHGGAMFSTDGAVTILNSTIVGNNAPAGTTGGLMVATFGAPVEVTLQNSIVAHNGDYSCQIEGDPAVAVLTSLGNNLFSDGSCAPQASDQIVTDAGVDMLAGNGGPTLTRALLPGSPAIDAANTAVCPALDQRGLPRDADCDIGAFEFVP